MKRLLFSTRKKKLLEFTATELAYQPQASNASLQNIDIMIDAKGEVTFQEAGVTEEMLLGNYPCQLAVYDNDEEIMHQAFMLTLVVLEPDHLIARLSQPH